MGGRVGKSKTGEAGDRPEMSPGHGQHPTRPDFLARCVIWLVLGVWALGATADVLTERYTQPWSIHVIALCTVSYALTGQFIDPKLPGVFRPKDPTGS